MTLRPMAIAAEVQEEARVRRVRDDLAHAGVPLRACGWVDIIRDLWSMRSHHSSSG
jgi:hypothetical protein